MIGGVKVLEFYLYSTVISWVVFYIVKRSLHAKITREGYVIKKEASSFWEKAHAWLYLLLPVINLVIDITWVLAHERAYEVVKKDCYVKEE